MTDPGNPAFDSEQLAQVFGDDVDVQCEIIGVFLSQLDLLLEDVGTAVASRDAVAIHRGAHALKGSAASLGARPLAEAAARLESLGRAHEFEGASTALQEVRDEAERAREALDGFLRDRAA